jgi:hypothetical protein
MPNRQSNGTTKVVPFQDRAQRIAGRAAAVSALALLLAAGCRQDMQDQPKMDPQRGSDFFADHRGARPQVLNTVARGQLHQDSYFYTGVVQAANGYRQELDEMPFPVTMEVLKRGQERFNIYCTPAIPGWATAWVRSCSAASSRPPISTTRCTCRSPSRTTFT